MVEIWKDIKGYEGLYQVSNWGNVRSLDRYKKTKNNSFSFIHGQLLKQYVTNRGYLNVYLYSNGKNKFFSIHRLVATHFLKNKENKPQVDHIDYNKFNNHVDNLRWCSASENMRNEITYTKNIKEHKKAKKQVNCYSLDGKFLKKFESITSVKKEGHSAGIVSMCCRGLKNKHHNMLWKYAS